MSNDQSNRFVLPSEAVVTRIANSEGIDPLELPPLYEAIDADALDALVGTGKRSDADPEVEFTYSGYEVTITSDAVIHLTKDTPQTTS